MIVSILNKKGGSGKTTLAINLARYFTKQNEETILIDTDPQGSTMNWHECSQGDLLEVACLHRSTIQKDIQKYAMHYKWIFIDGIPQISDLTTSTIKCSDVVLVPVQPSPHDIWDASDIIELIKTHQSVANGKPKTAFVVSRRISNTKLGKNVHESLKAYGLPVFKNYISQRIIYPESANVGSTVLDIGNIGREASEEVELIANELMEFINVNDPN